MDFNEWYNRRIPREKEVIDVKYSLTCPACGHVLDVEAMDDNDAVSRLVAAGEKHMKEVHPDMPEDPNMEQMVREQMRKEEGEEA